MESCCCYDMPCLSMAWRDTPDKSERMNFYESVKMLCVGVLRCIICKKRVCWNHSVYSDITAFHDPICYECIGTGAWKHPADGAEHEIDIKYVEHCQKLFQPLLTKSAAKGIKKESL